MSQWLTLAANFPATLVKDIEPEFLKDGQTPDAYGLGLDKPGTLYAGSFPSTATTPPSFKQNAATNNNTPVSLPGSKQYYYIDDRAWVIDLAGQNLYFFAKGFGNNLYTQGFPKIQCDDIGNCDLLWLAPCAGGVAAFLQGDTPGTHSDVLYFLPNTVNPQGAYDRRTVIDLGLYGGPEATTDICYFRDVVYWSSPKGVFSFDGREVKEWTRAIRNNLGNFTGAHLDGTNSSGVLQREQRLVADDGTKKYVVDLGTGGLYDYTTTGFRWTSRSLSKWNDKAAQVCIDRIALVYTHDSTADKTVKYQIMKSDETWYDAESVKIEKQNRKYARYEFRPNLVERFDKWAFRITALPANMLIHEVQIQVDAPQALRPEGEV